MPSYPTTALSDYVRRSDLVAILASLGVSTGGALVGPTGPQGPPGPSGVAGAAGGALAGTYPNPSLASGAATGIALGTDVLTTGTAQVKTGTLTAPIIDKGGQTVNVKAYGALGDGTTDDTASILAAIAFAKGSSLVHGTTHSVFMPMGNYRVSAQIVVPHMVVLRGENSYSTQITVLPSFPVSTALIRLGEAGTAYAAFNCRVEDIYLDCQGIAGSICVYTDDIQEGCGLLRMSLGGYRDCGFRADGTDQFKGACDFFIRDCEVGPSTNATGTVGLDIVNVRTKWIADNLSICYRTFQLLPVEQLAGVRIVGAAATDGYGMLTNLHIENSTHGVLFGTFGQGYTVGIEARNCVNSITLSTSSRVVCMATMRSGTTTYAINDTVAGETVVDTPFYYTGAAVLNARNLRLVRESANLLSMRNGANGQGVRFYNSDVGADTEFMNVGFNTNVARIDTGVGGAGTMRSMVLGAGSGAHVYLGPGGSSKWQFVSTGQMYAMVDNVYDVGQVANNRPRNMYMGGSVIMRTKAGAPVDADFTNPADGMECLDTTNHRYYLRSGAVWRYTQLT